MLGVWGGCLSLSQFKFFATLQEKPSTLPKLSPHSKTSIAEVRRLMSQSKKKEEEEKTGKY